MTASREDVKSRLKRGFTIARWGIDICLGALFITIALLLSAAIRKEVVLLTMLMIPVVMCIAGLIIFAIGRVMVGLQSRKLNLYTDRPLTEEERWFVGCMLEIEETGAGVNFFNNAARASGGSGDDIVAGAAATVIMNRFFKVGKDYMGSSILFNRLPVIVSLAVSVVIVILAIV